MVIFNKMHKFVLVGILLLLSGAVTGTSYIQANGQTIAKINDSGIYYYHSDHLGSTSAMTDSEGEVIEEQVNLPFGQPVSGSEKYGFTGKEFDPDLDLNYFMARYYSPLTGRFLNSDPAQDGVNWYSYASNNPLTRVDPTGESDIRTNKGFVFAMNVLRGALIGGTGSKIHGGGFWEGARKGAIGGAITFGGKALSYHIDKPGVGWAAKFIHSAGASMIESAVRGEFNYRTDIGPLSVQLGKETKINLKLFTAASQYDNFIFGAVEQPLGPIKKKTSLKYSLMTLTPVYCNEVSHKNFIWELPAFNFIGSINVLFPSEQDREKNEFFRLYETNEEWERSMIGHEFIHTLQKREIDIFDTFLPEFLSDNALHINLASDISLYIWGGITGRLPYTWQPPEMEAHSLAWYPNGFLERHIYSKGD